MLAPGNLRAVYEAFRGRWSVGDHVGYGDVNPLAAELVLGIVPSWYVLSVQPAQERLAAAHLVGRRFGIFVPEFEQWRLFREKRQKKVLPMFPGYVFVFTWLSAANHHRVVSCPGVVDFLRRVTGAPAIVDDALIDAVRIQENKQRPMVLDCETVGFVRGRRGYRRFRKIVHEQQTIEDTQVIGVHTWSALRDGLQELDGNGRNRLLHEALGV